MPCGSRIARVLAACTLRTRVRAVTHSGYATNVSRQPRTQRMVHSLRDRAACRTKSSKTKVVKKTKAADDEEDAASEEEKSSEKKSSDEKVHFDEM